MPNKSQSLIILTLAGTLLLSGCTAAQDQPLTHQPTDRPAQLEPTQTPPPEPFTFTSRTTRDALLKNDRLSLLEGETLNILDLNTRQTLHEVPLTPDSYYDIDFTDRYVVWSAEQRPAPNDPNYNPDQIPADIYLYDLTRKEVKRITRDDHDQIRPQIWENYIVWMDDRHTTKDMYPQTEWKIYLYDIDTGEETLISRAPGSHTGPAIDAGKVVWEDGRHVTDPILRGGGNVPDNNTDIYLYDIAAQKEIPIATGPLKQGIPDISDNRIVWEDYNKLDDYSGDIFLYDLSTQSTKQITSDRIRQFHPKIHGDRIIWTDERRGGSSSDLYINGQKPNSDVYLYDLRTGEERRLSEDKVDHSGMISANWVFYAEVTDMEATLRVLPLTD